MSFINSLFSTLGQNAERLGASALGSKLGTGISNTFVGATNLFTRGIGTPKATDLSSALKNIFPFYSNNGVWTTVDHEWMSKRVNANGMAFLKNKQTASFWNDDAISHSDALNRFKSNVTNPKHLQDLNKLSIHTTAEGHHVVGMYQQDIRKYAPNPSIGRRLMIGAGGLSIAQSMGSMGNVAPPPTYYSDGVNMRREGDMGADASYARSILGNNSGL